MKHQPEIIQEADCKAIEAAAQVLKRGELVAFPTETVYGLGGDACCDQAVAKIFAAKARPQFNPLIVHVASLEAAMQLAMFSDLALKLARAYWPGPLTLVVPQRPARRPDFALSKLASAGLETVALRVPDHGVALALLAAFNGPVAAPSANPSGRLSPTEAEHVEEGLGDRLSLILDAGACPVGVESTIVGFQNEHPTLLRPGAISVEDLQALTGQKLLQPRKSDTPQSAGQLASHYAPNARLRLHQHRSQPGEMLLAFGPDAPKGVPGLNLSPTGDLTEAAANLFAYLHILDGTGVKTINVMPIPNTGLGRAINDRLARAAAPRPRHDDKP